MADFNKAFDITLGHEGGYANDPVDTGGETVFGITRRDHRKSGIWPIVDSYKKKYGSKAIPYINKDATILSMARAIYKTSYWDINRLDQINDQAIASELFDTGVNMGTGIAARFIQGALNASNKNQLLYPDLKLDGDVGPVTLSRINGHPNKSLLLKLLNVMQGARYLDIMQAAPAQERFCLSWFSRVEIIKL